ncbi:hypothetical protein BKA67DRAFT_577553 [Truncatella angustata]|uniref:Uncharacterized protein n=1 Tax=Truncatella angustata TaxID=152316 RepID=A0A9P8UD10_9PEZI|nr:uncharacterized protein BKA67DRAFT_577553 [Truncatella angustata]KAH6647468.1 hypothetical protein BKA67DRAFT_577553 [Truncatella angustata]
MLRTLLGYTLFCCVLQYAAAKCKTTSSTSSTLPPVDTHCPTVTSKALCSTCNYPACLEISTISNPCDCSAPVPTVSTTYPCDGSCPSFRCAGTQYVSATSSSVCDSTPTEPRTDCTPTVTVSAYPSEGCSISCGGFCIIDKFVTFPCGCPTVGVGVVTTTEVQPCPTTAPCYDCHTGFPFTTVESPCPTDPLPTATS